MLFGMPKKRSRRLKEPKASRTWQLLLLGVVAVCAVTLSVIALTANRVDHGDAAAIPPQTAPLVQPTAVFFGDSYVAGDGLENKPAERWSALLSAAENWTESNLGVGGTGYTTAGTLPGGGRKYIDGVERIAQDMPDIVLVAGGRNDSGDAADAISEFYRALRDALPNATIVAIQPMFDAGAYPQGLTVISGQVQAAVEAVGGTYLPLPNPLEGHPELIGDDGIHPNAAGHAALEVAIKAALDAARINVTTSVS